VGGHKKEREVQKGRRSVNLKLTRHPSAKKWSHVKGEKKKERYRGGNDSHKRKIGRRERQFHREVRDQPRKNRTRKF